VIFGIHPALVSRARRALRAALCILLLVVSATPSPGQNPLTRLVERKTKAADSKTADNKAVAAPQPADQPVAPQIIPLPQVAIRSEQLTQTLSDIAASLPTDDQLVAVNAAITEQAETLKTKRHEAETILSSAPSSIELREQENYWRGFQNLSAARRKQLLDWANASQAAVDQLNVFEPQWAATLDAYKDQHELQPVLDLVRQNLAHIRKLRADATDKLQLVVKMQIATGALDQSAAEVLARLLGAQAVYKDRIFRRDSLPIWQLGARREQGENKGVFGTATSRLITIKAFLEERRGTIVFLLVVFVLSTMLAYRLYVATRNAHPADETSAQALLLLRRWVALGILAPLLFAYALAPAMPLSLVGLVILASFFPILRLLAPLLHPRRRFMLYCLTGYYALNVLITWLGLTPVLLRELNFLASLALLLTFAYFLRPSWLRALREGGGGHPPIVFGARIALAALGCSLVANLFGYVRLAQYLGLACIYSAFIGVGIYTGTCVYTTLLRAAMHLPQTEHLAAARLHRQGLLRWVPRVLVAAGFLVWLAATLDLLRVRDQIIGTAQAVLDFPIAGSASEITLGSVLGFFLMLALGYVVASTVRFLLREEVLNRFHLARGLPDLIASTVYYLLLLFVFLIAVNAGGIELNKFTLLTGALGVGFGFGLQNIINNFVSGLILQFERPIHINDVLEVDGYTGTVTRIGVRSSTLQTFQGAEVIIPNASLISGKVINWTLSESRRRAELPLGVAYGTDPNIVLKFLLDAANKQESVLTDPPPAAYFKGFGESSLDFELQFWVMQDSNWVKVRSDIAMVVMKSLEDAGIEIPFPQRDLHLRSVDEGAGIQSSQPHEADTTKSVPIRRKTVSADGD